MRVSDPETLTTFRCQIRSTSVYRRGRILLAGDAVHIHSPAGGQGMNTGILDATNLAWKLALVVSGRAPDALLDSYGTERAPVAAQVLGFTQSIVPLRHSAHLAEADRAGRGTTGPAVAGRATAAGRPDVADPRRYPDGPADPAQPGSADSPAPALGC